MIKFFIKEQGKETKTKISKSIDFTPEGICRIFRIKFPEYKKESIAISEEYIMHMDSNPVRAISDWIAGYKIIDKRE